jgi:hypothetical protein
MDAYTRMALLCTRHIYVHADEDNVQRIYYDGKKNLSSNELSSVHCPAKLLVEA